ncbi:MAG: CopG family transcriptional regulator [Adlercreutzia sp.]|nr:CopG family transcriptional regulator [Adlercreutzia sp.]
MTDTITAEEFDRLFDEGADISEYVDLDNGVMVDGRNETRRVNVDFPHWMIADLDEEADRLAISRQAVIKMIVDEGLKRRKTAAGR